MPKKPKRKQAEDSHATEYAKDEYGVWRFADSEIAVPGARDLTLSERFRPKAVLAEDGETTERVIVSGEDIRREPELLGWCLEHGARIANSYGKVTEVLVPYELWQQHDYVPNAIYAPENSPNEAERELARAERRYREAEAEFQDAADARAETLRRYAPEMTRQEARKITGLSIGRIQQLISGDYKLGTAHLLMLQIIGTGTGMTAGDIVEGAERRSISLGANAGRRMRDLEQQGLIERKGNRYSLTAEGRDVLSDDKSAG